MGERCWERVKDRARFPDPSTTAFLLIVRAGAYGLNLPLKHFVFKHVFTINRPLSKPFFRAPVKAPPADSISAQSFKARLHPFLSDYIFAEPPPHTHTRARARDLGTLKELRKMSMRFAL